MNLEYKIRNIEPLDELAGKTHSGCCVAYTAQNATRDLITTLEKFVKELGQDALKIFPERRG